MFDRLLCLRLLPWKERKLINKAYGGRWGSETAGWVGLAWHESRTKLFWFWCTIDCTILAYETTKFKIKLLTLKSLWKSQLDNLLTKCMSIIRRNKPFHPTKPMIALIKCVIKRVCLWAPKHDLRGYTISAECLWVEILRESAFHSSSKVRQSIQFSFILWLGVR